jgi:hypothetical protein
MTVVDVLQSFQARPTNAEQAERLAAIRKAAASFAAILHQGLRPGEFRDAAVIRVHEVLMYAAESIQSEEASESGVEARTRILDRVAAGKAISARDIAILRGMLGCFSKEDLAPEPAAVSA